MPDNTLPNSINQPHIAAFETIYAQKLSEVDISVVMTYIIDIAPENVLYYLASQWDVTGVKGWKFADTIEKKRNLVRNAIKLNLIIGTPRAIITALNSIGYPDVTIDENLIGAKYDGTYDYNGAIDYNQGYHWAYFKVYIGINNIQTLTGQMFLDAIDVINAWKNLRSWLFGLYMLMDGEEQVGITDDLILTGSGIFDFTFDNTYE